MARTYLALMLAMAGGAGAAAQTSESRGAALELVKVLTEQQRDTVATVDPRDAGRFIAAMYVPPSQLLVVGARYHNVDALNALVREGRDRDVYMDLQTGSVVDDKVFIHDMGADGLVQSGASIIDNAYRNGARAELAKNGRVTEEFARVDQEYSRMLRALASTLARSMSAPAVAAKP